MSHAATKWAFDQPELHRDMKPSEWAVLMVLADCHNPVNGCFPSQDYICTKTNLAERAVRDQLARLRDRRLINWEAARENGKRGSNRYSLAFEDDFQPANSAGCPTGEIEPDQPAESDTFNRQNLPPNLVREPVREPIEREARAREPEPAPESDAEFQKLLKRYPGVHSPALAFPAWLRLDAEGRRRANARLDAYLAERRKLRNDTVFALQRYLAERLFDQVDEPADGKPVLTMVAPRTREFWALVAAGKASRVAFDLARQSGTPLTIRVADLPGAEETAALVAIETGGAAFDAWARHLTAKGLRMRAEDTHLCGRFIYVPAEYPPGRHHDPPPAGRGAEASAGRGKSEGAAR